MTEPVPWTSDFDKSWCRSVWWACWTFYWCQWEEVGFHDPCSSQGFQALETNKTKEFHNTWLGKAKREILSVPGVLSHSVYSPEGQHRQKTTSSKTDPLVLFSAKCHTICEKMWHVGPHLATWRHLFYFANVGRIWYWRKLGRIS